MSAKYKANQKNVLINIGPRHLFLTSTFYYLWALKDEYNLYVIADNDYVNFDEANSFLSEFAVRIFYKPQRNSFKNHFRLKQIIKEAVFSSNLDVCLTHDTNYVDGQYLKHFICQINKDKFFFEIQTGKLPVKYSEWQSDFKARLRSMASRLAGPNASIFSFKAKLFFLKISNLIRYFINFKFYPLIIIRKVFNPHINIYNGMVKPSNKNTTKVLCYINKERDFYKNHLFYTTFLIKHPISEFGKNALKYFYDYKADLNSNIIFIAPSYGFTDIMRSKGMPPKSIINNISLKWIQSIDKLKLAFKDYDINIKLHPASCNDFIWNEIIKIIKHEFPEVKILDPLDNAEMYVLRSEVIVSDVSAVPWCASFYDDKIVVSLDIFDYEGGDTFKNYSDQINYINNIDNIISLSSTNKRINNNLSIGDFLKEYL